MALPDMTRAARAARQRAYQEGCAYALERVEIVEAGASGYATREERVEFLRGIGQYFNGLAHDLTQQAQTQDS